MAEKNIKQLLSLWKKEKEEYKTAEIGTGVQRFVKHIFECKELFNLEEGHLATADLKRKNEFLTEAKKKGRRADVVIFLDSDVVIPVEVEKYTYIKSGIQQIFNYQGDWSKKLGLLTDGNEWWFYNNRFVEKKFFIKDILEKPTIFLTYWKEYTTPDYYYRSFFEKKGQLKLFEEPTPQLDDVREDFFLDITKLIENFENKLNLKGYFNRDNDETESKKRAVEISYAYLIQFILYKVLVDNAFGDFEDDWKERLKSIDNAIKAEAYGDVLTKIKGISDKISNKIYKRFNDEQLIINEKLKDILSEPKTNIGDVSVWLDILLFINRYNFANVQNEIFGYVYENYLKDLYLNEKKGQYFTDPHVVEFMLNEMGYTKENLQKRYIKDKDSISIIDPSCGSGTFLYNATNRLVEAFFNDSSNSSKLAEQIINNNIIGFDIAEFPLYLAEMNILMRMLPVIINESYNNPVEQKINVFKTRDSIAEFLDTALKNTLTDINVAHKKSHGQFSLFTEALDLGYDSFMRNKGDLDILKKTLEIENGKPRTKFDFVVGNPPYVSFKECSKQKLLFFELQKEKKIKMNDIYGFNLHSIPTNIKKYAPNPNLYAYFIALGIALLKDGGIISYIIPQTILYAGDLDVLRFHLSKFYTIEKIVNFSGKMFVGRGIKQNKPIPTSSLIFFLKKSTPSKAHKVKIVNYNNITSSVEEVISNLNKNKNTTIFEITQNELVKNVLNWNFILQSKLFIELYKDYLKFSESLEKYYNHELSKHYYKSKFYFDRGLKYPKDKLKENFNDGDDLNIPILEKKCFLAKKSNENISISLLDFPHGSQGLGVFKLQYKIIWSYINYDCFRFSDEDIMIDYNHVLISSNNKTEILYLFTLLNSTISKIILNNFLKNENEKDILIGIKSIKELIKSPIINSENEIIKTEIINSTLKLLEMEKNTLSDLVDFKGLMLQKFDNLEVRENNLIIRYKENEAKCKIIDNLNLVEDIVLNLMNSTNKIGLFNQDGTGSISILKSLTAFDKEYQAKLKNYIDDLVYALYFKINLIQLSFENAVEIKNTCAEHQYYQLVNSQ
jgi:hypothetical protein